MGKLIVSWSPVQGQSASTSNSIALSSMMALDEVYRSLLTHTQFNGSVMEKVYMKSGRSAFDDGGLVALERLVKSKLLTPTDVVANSEIIYNSKLDFLSTSKKVGETNERNTFLYTILSSALQTYDFIWLDLHAGTDEKTARGLLEQADLVLVNLPQNKFIIEEFFNHNPYLDVLEENSYFVVIGQYDSKAGHSIRNIKRQHKLKAPIFGIPYVTGYKNAANQETISNFFYRALKVNKGDPLYEFINAIRQTNKSVLKELGFSETEE